MDRARGPLSVSDLTAGLPITRQATTRHLDALPRAGLIRVRRAGRERLHELDAGPLRAIDEWLQPYAAVRGGALERLRRHVEEDQR